MLLALADEADACYPGQQRLAVKCGLTTRRLRDHLDALEAHGYIARRRRHLSDGRRTSDFYELRLADETSVGGGG